MKKILEVINFKKHIIYDKFRENAKGLFETLIRIEGKLNGIDRYRYLNKNLEPIMPFPKRLFNALKAAARRDMNANELKIIRNINGDISYFVISENTYVKTINDYFFNEAFSFFKERGYFKSDDRESLKNKILNYSDYESLVSLHSIYHDFLHFLLNPKHDEILKKYSSPIPDDVSNEEYIKDMNAILDEIIIFFVQGSSDPRFNYDYLSNKYVAHFFYVFAAEFMKFLIKKKNLSLDDINDIYSMDSKEISREMTNFMFLNVENPKNKYVIIMKNFFMNALLESRKKGNSSFKEFDLWCYKHVRSVNFLENLNDIFSKYASHSNVLELDLFETIDEFNRYVLELAKRFEASTLRRATK